MRDAKPYAIVLLSLRAVAMSCDTCPAYMRLKTLYDATCATYRNEHIAHEAWTSDDDGKMVITPAGLRALEHYDQLLKASGEAARMMMAIKRTWGPESADDGADGELWAWLNGFVTRYSQSDASGEVKS